MNFLVCVHFKGLTERAEVALKARRYMSRHFADNKIQRALQHNTPPAADRDYSPGDQVLIWRENQVENRIGEWIEPYTVVSYDSEAKIVLVQRSADAQYERYNTVQVKPFETPSETARKFSSILHSAVRPFASEHPAIVHITEVIDKHDPRASTPEMLVAIREEVRDLSKRGTFKVLLKKELPDGANALTARFVLAIKSNADGETKYKSRYIIGGHRDVLKHFMVHGA